MKKIIRRISAAVLAAAMAMGALMTSASANDEEKSWSVVYVSSLPSAPGRECTVEMVKLPGAKFQTYCGFMEGGNDRRVTVSAPGVSSFLITTTGYSDPFTSSSSGMILFTFSGYSTSSCSASGTIGYY